MTYRASHHRNRSSNRKPTACQAQRKHENTLGWFLIAISVLGFIIMFSIAYIVDQSRNQVPDYLRNAPVFVHEDGSVSAIIGVSPGYHPMDSNICETDSECEDLYGD